MRDATSSLIVLKELAGNTAPHFGLIQNWMAPYVEIIRIFWVVVWFATVAFLAVVVYDAYIQASKDWRRR